MLVDARRRRLSPADEGGSGRLALEDGESAPLVEVVLDDLTEHILLFALVEATFAVGLASLEEILGHGCDAKLCGTLRANDCLRLVSIVEVVILEADDSVALREHISNIALSGVDRAND